MHSLIIHSPFYSLKLNRAESPSKWECAKIQGLLSVFFSFIFNKRFGLFWVWVSLLFPFLVVLMDDDGSWVIESLDSLWFFSHVFSSSTATAQFLSFPTDENTSSSSSDQPVFEQPSKPISQVLLQIQDHQTHQEPPRCAKCGESVAAEIEPEMWKPMNMEEEMVLESPKYWTADQKEERRKKRRKRCKKSMKQGRKILGELDLCFDGKEVWMLDENCGGGYCNESFGSADYYKYNYKMPPFGDNMAMKEHLKSWAYAVACTVR